MRPAEPGFGAGQGERQAHVRFRLEPIGILERDILSRQRDRAARLGRPREVHVAVHFRGPAVDRAGQADGGPTILRDPDSSRRPPRRRGAGCRREARHRSRRSRQRFRVCRAHRRWRGSRGPCRSYRSRSQTRRARADRQAPSTLEVEARPDARQAPRCLLTVIGLPSESHRSSSTVARPFSIRSFDGATCLNGTPASVNDASSSTIDARARSSDSASASAVMVNAIAPLISRSCSALTNGASTLGVMPATRADQRRVRGFPEAASDPPREPALHVAFRGVSRGPRPSAAAGVSARAISRHGTAPSADKHRLLPRGASGP